MSKWDWAIGKQLDLEDVNPESAWQRMLIAEDPHLDRHSSVPLFLAVSHKTAASIVETLSGESSLIDDEKKSLVGAMRIGQDVFEVLMNFVSTGDVGERHCMTVLVPDPELRQFLTEITSSTWEVEVIDIGVPLHERLYCEPTPVTNLTTVGFSEILSRGSKAPDVGAVVGIIDFGIGFVNHRFRSCNSTPRFEHFWAMNVPPLNESTAPLVGREWSKQEIKKAIVTGGESDDIVYERLGASTLQIDDHQPLLRRYSHGTHVLDIASGRDYSQEGAVGDCPLIGVQLPVEIVEDTSGAGASPWLSLALDWMLVRAVHLSKERGWKNLPPLVLNFSFGVNAGPMDGQSVAEIALQNFLENYNRLSGKRNCWLVLPAGNSFLDRSYYRSKLGSSVTIPWRVVPEDLTASYVHILLPNVPDNSSATVKVKLIPPVAELTMSRVSKVGHKVDLEYDGFTIARIYHRKELRPGDCSRELISIAIRPTGSRSGADPIAPSGLWKIVVVNEGYAGETIVEARVQRDGAPLSFKQRGKQSYFDDPSYVVYEEETGRIRTDDVPEACPVVRSGAINSYGSGALPILVGGYVEASGEPSVYSSSGPVNDMRFGPDLAAISDTSHIRPGVKGAGTMTGSVGSFGGTSVAAPAVTKKICEFLSSGVREEMSQPKFDLVRYLVAMTAVKRESQGIRGPNGAYFSKKAGSTVDKRLGFGRLESSRKDVLV